VESQASSVLILEESREAHFEVSYVDGTRRGILESESGSLVDEESRSLERAAKSALAAPRQLSLLWEEF
jgi:hypothetical protein